MLYYLSQYLQAESVGTHWEPKLSSLRLFQYITFRSAGAAITALLLSWWMGPRVIAWLKELKFGQNYEDKAAEGGDLKARILSKKGTPTMGGILIVLTVDLSALLWTQWNELVMLTLLSLMVLAGLGFYDDYAKITKQNSLGTTSLVKLGVQTALGVIIAIYLWRLPRTHELISDVMVPFWKYPIVKEATVLGILLAAL